MHVFNVKSRVETRLLSPNTTYGAHLSYKTTEFDGYNFDALSPSSPPIEELFPQTNEMLPRGFKLKRKLFMKRGKTHRFIKVNRTHRVS